MKDLVNFVGGINEKKRKNLNRRGAICEEEVEVTFLFIKL